MTADTKGKFNFYYLGLDIGTNSVGWAVTDESYQILRYRGQDMWGVHLFDEAKTAVDRRAFRTARRRRERARNRLQWLRDLLHAEIEAKDARFFQRLDEAARHRMDRTPDGVGARPKYTLFNDPDYGDKDYHREFPTAYHLRHTLCQPWKRKYDIRLVYLALAHILKSRGNFLYQGASFETGSAFEEIYAEFEEAASNCGLALPKVEHEGIKSALQLKGITRKTEGLVQLYGAKKNKPLSELFKLIAGRKINVNTLLQTDEDDTDYKALFDEDDTLKEFSLEKSDFDEKVLSALESILSEPQVALMVVAKKLYDWTVLCHILGEHKTLSESMIAQYDKHHAQVAQLKRLVKKYCPKQHDSFFKDKTSSNNYIAWIGKGDFKNNSSVCTQDEFEKSVKDLLKNIPDSEDNKKRIIEEIEGHAFLPKLRTGSNGVIPHQLHLLELQAILKNASGYYPFLSEQNDDSRFTVAQKVEKILTFRIPYYVGPLTNKHSAEKDPQHGHAWIVRNEGFEYTPIRPWNFDDAVNREACAEAFIRRMTNKCTYLPTCDTVPKESLLYSEFMVLNQLNNLKISGNPIDRESKKKLFALCKTQQSVSKKHVAKELGVKEDELSGFDGDLKLSLKSYHDFRAILGDEAMKQDNVKEFVESCILASTIFNESTDDLLANRIRKSAKEKGISLTEQQLRKIGSLHYKDWGNFSREFLTQIDGYNRGTGECYSIIQALRDETDNLMQLLSSRKYTFSENVRKYNDAHRSQTHCLTYHSLVQPLHCSPSVKRALWRTLAIVKDVIRVTRHAPARIFVEMARDDANKKKENKGKRTVSRKDQLLAKFRQIKDDPETVAELIQILEGTGKRKIRDEDLRRSKDKLFLYFSQSGRCMYSGNPIDLDRLLGDQANNIWDIDHIYPQSKVMDNSLDNRVLVEKKLNNHKQDRLPIPSGVVSESAIQHWKWLVKHGLISKEKYDRLTRNNDLTADELAGFIQRQLVETRQTTKLVCEILREAFEKQGTRIVYSHAGHVTAFRNEHIDPERGHFEMVKCRDVNDFHHAKDAYLNIVVGNILFTRFTQNPADIFKSGEHVNVQFYSHNERKSGLLEKEAIRRFDPIAKREICAWIPNKSIAIVRKNVSGTRILFTRYEYEERGGFYNENPLKSSFCKQNKVPIKTSISCFQDCKRYGGYNSDNGAYFFLVEYTYKKKRKRVFRFVPVRLASAIRRSPERLLQYCRDPEPFGLNLNSPRILIDKILLNARFIFNGFPFTTKGRHGNAFDVRHCLQLVLPDAQTRYLKLVVKCNEDIALHPGVSIKELHPDVSSEENICLYNAFLNKLRNKSYKMRPGVKLEMIEAGLERFKELSIEHQCVVLKNMLVLFSCATTGRTDLRLIGGSQEDGRMSQSFDLDNYETAFLEHPSPTGLTCKRINLKEL